MNKKILIRLFILVITTIFFVLYSCTTSIKSLYNSPENFDGKQVRIEGKIDKILFLSKKDYKIYLITDNEIGKSIYILSSKDFKKNEDISVLGMVYYIKEKIKKQKRDMLIDQIKKFLIKHTMINEKVVFMDAIKIVDFVEIIAREKKGIMFMIGQVYYK